MTILFVMIPLAVLLLAAAVAAFFWAVRSGQFDDLETHGTMVLFDEEPVPRARGQATSGASATPARTVAQDLCSTGCSERPAEARS